jgi:hypothetical protein
MLTIREQINLTPRLDYSGFRIHYRFKKLMDNAPHLKSGDIQGLLEVIRGWFADQSNFEYSLLDIWMNKDVQFKLLDDLLITGLDDAFNLSYNSGVCCHLAIKCKSMINILYPWADVAIVETYKWRKGTGNHFFITLAEGGFKNSTSFVETNLNFGDPDRFATRQTVYPQGITYAIDPTRSVVTQISNDELYQEIDNLWLSIGNNFQQSTTKVDNQVGSLLVHRTAGEEFGCLSIKFDKSVSKLPLWKMSISGEDQFFDFHGPEILTFLSTYDPTAGIKLAIIQRKGFR